MLFGKNDDNIVVSFPRRRYVITSFLMTSHLRHHIILGINILFFSKMSPLDGSCQKLGNCVYICWSYAEKTVACFSRTRRINHSRNTVWGARASSASMARRHCLRVASLTERKVQVLWVYGRTEIVLTSLTSSCQWFSTSIKLKSSF